LTKLDQIGLTKVWRPEPLRENQLKLADGGAHQADKQPRQAESSSVLARLRSYIQEGKYRPGDKLPPERVLAAELEVGRPAIREGIKALVILDVLESRRGDGTYLKSIRALSSGWPALVEISDNDFSMLELLEVRKLIEPRAAALATARGSEQELREIVEAKTALDDESLGWQEIGPADFALHAGIIKASGNSILNRVHGYLGPMLLKSREITTRSVRDFSRMRADHSAIVEAICRGESAAAEKSMLEHMHTVGLDLISSKKR
jgi:GntR family transcriptional repressor for pyruvate dehydrogenase complex